METKVFVYVEDFEYKDSFEKSRFYGHPKPGKIYKAIKKDNKYKIDLPSIDNAAGIILVREGVDNDIDICNYKFYEITDRNITDLDVDQEELDTILGGWVTEVKNHPSSEEEDITVERIMSNIEKFDVVSDNLNIIFEEDEEMFDRISDIIRRISEDYIESKNESSIESIIRNIKNLK